MYSARKRRGELNLDVKESIINRILNKTYFN